MKDTEKKPLFWVLPLIFALPFIAGAAVVLVKYGDLLTDLVHVASKAVLIP